LIVDKHDLVSSLKELALELGRTPTRAEFEAKTRGGKHHLEKQFGTFSLLVQAAGLVSAKEKQRRIDNSIFERDLADHLDAYTPKASTLAQPEPYQRTLFIGDTHFPFVDERTLERIVRFAEREQPEVVAQLGDLYDAYAAAKFPRSLNVFTPRQEQDIARKGAETMWSEIRRACPKARLVQCRGNHDDRPLKRVLESYPEAEDWVVQMVRKLMTFDGVETLEDSRQELILPGNVMAHHGYMGRPGAHRDHNVGYNFVFGHTHTGHVVYRQIQGQVRWEMNVGYVGNPDAKGLSYTPQRAVGWTPGWGFLDEYGPRFVPA
jgi:predicted phosphodiesterase